MEETKLVLLIGVTGHSGRYAVERLAERRADCAGLRFRALVRPTSNLSHIETYGLPMEYVVGDINDDACLASALSGVDTVLNVYGIIKGSDRVLRMAAEAHVKRVITVHTTGIYSRYKNASAGYIEMDRAVTAIAAEHGIALTILRPTMIYGDTDDENVVTFIRMMDRLPVMPVVAGANFPLQPVHRRDLGHAYADVLLAPEKTAGKNYTLSGGAPITLRAMLTAIADCLGKKARFVSVPYWVAITGARFLYCLSIGKLDYREKVQRLVEPRAYPHDEATRDFGYAPMTFAAGVRDEVAAYLAEKNGK